MTWLWYLAGLASGVVVTIPLMLLKVRHQIRRTRHLEHLAIASQRLAELGTLTGGLAHEIKNPLSTVNLNIQLVQEDLQDLTSQLTSQQPIKERFERIQRRIDSLARVTQQLRQILEDFLQFAGRIKLDRTPTDINAMIGELTDFFAPQAQNAGIRLRTQLSAQPATIAVDSSLLKQALLNLLLNALQAITAARESGQPTGGGDELIIRTQRTRLLDSPDLQVHITDTGPGIDPEHLERIFLPYFGTKRQGTGLGLPTARRIVEEHGGVLTVHSEPGRGTDFTISLPTDAPADTA